MSPIALNTLAIGIFSMTMLSLLGPVIQLSPWIPSVLALGFLSFATLDTLQWRGQGLTLLLNAVARQSPEYRQRVLHHEAGHVLVAHLLGILVTHYALNAWEAFRQGQVAQGGVSFDEAVIEQDLMQLQRLSRRSEAQQILNRYAIVWMAGIAAEALFTGTAIGGAEDRARLAQVLEQFGYSPQAIVTQQRWAVLQARTLLQKQDVAYQALCAAMQEHQAIAACHEIIQTHQVSDSATDKGLPKKLK